MGEESECTEHMGEEPERTEHMGEESERTKHMGEESERTKHMGEESVCTEYMGEESECTEHMGEESERTKHMGEESERTKHMGEESTGTDGHVDNAPSTLKRRLRYLGENTTLHGIPRIISSDRWYRKLIWCLIFIAVLCYLGYQLWGLWTVFTNNQIKTAIHVNQPSVLKFPAITVCNANPIRKSKISTPSRPSSSQVAKGGTSVTRKVSDMFKTFLRVEQSQTNASGTSKSKKKWFNIFGLKKMLGRRKRSTLDTLLSDVFGGLSGEGEQGGGLLETGLSLLNTMKEMALLPLEYWYQSQMEFMYDVMSLEPDERVELGHQYTDFVVDCTVSGRKCLPHNSTMTTEKYGNCYTIQSDTYIATKNDPYEGIGLTLNLENFEFLEGFQRAYGAKVVVHEPGTVPLPDVEGITVSAGYETTLELKMSEVKRLGQPYSVCQDTETFSKQYGFGYTRQVCSFLCEKKAIVSRCACVLRDIQKDQLHATIHSDENHPSCQLTDECDMVSPSVFECAMSVRRDNLLDLLDCGCGDPCTETVYDTKVTGRIWPTDDYLVCYLFSPLYRKFIELLNFLRIVVYYKELRYSTISEEPFYEAICPMAKTYTPSQMSGDTDLFTQIQNTGISMRYQFLQHRYPRAINSYSTATHGPSIDKTHSFSDFSVPQSQILSVKQFIM
ncbi:hypothetical protein ScPMuIL_016425 [Solemya velum]